jgi:multicomponent Na+:H+ antiporter subunit E
MRDGQTNPGATADPRVFRKMIILTVVLAVVWLLWSGLFKPLLIGLGALSCVLTIWIVRRMGAFSDQNFTFQVGPRLLGFWIWLAKEIVISSLQVARITLAPSIRVSPRVVTLDVGNLKEVDQVLLGNAITLTPGTLTLDVYNDRMLVHALTEEGAWNLEAGEMQRRVAALRGN